MNPLTWIAAFHVYAAAERAHHGILTSYLSLPYSCIYITSLPVLLMPFLQGCYSCPNIFPHSIREPRRAEAGSLRPCSNTFASIASGCCPRKLSLPNVVSACCSGCESCAAVSVQRYERDAVARLLYSFCPWLHRLHFVQQPESHVQWQAIISRGALICGILRCVPAHAITHAML